MCELMNGQQVEGDGFCFTNDRTCCPNGWSCLSNGLCQLGSNDSYVQPSCEDWTSGCGTQRCYISMHFSSARTKITSKANTSG